MLSTSSFYFIVDVWDGAEEPVITHGMTLVKPIYLKDVAKAIDRYAFCVSEFPVILSLENHCSKAQQSLMCKIFHETFNDKLLTFPSGAPFDVFPSPRELKNKILIKAKISSHPKGAILRSMDQTDEGREDEIYDTEESEEENNSTSNCSPAQNIGSFVTRITVSDAKKEEPKVRVIPDLSEIIAMPNVKVKSIKSDARTLPFNGFAAFSEKKLDELRSEESLLDILAFTKKHFVKSYPSGLRIMSSNYDPVKCWNLGVQAVSLNAQTADDATDLNDAMFVDNGNCGYVLKPDLLIEDDVNIFRNDVTTLKIKIISGHYLPKPTTNPPIVNDIVDPFVTVQIYGFYSDSQKYKTKKIDNNGFNPYWNETCQFKLKYPELAFVRFLVEDYDIASSNDFVGEFSLPVRLLKQGYGHVRLRTGSRHHKDPTAVLFVHIEIVESPISV
uniref:Phosphoinositide phospholipase C n=1 Tax=Romanomermis culicivorax TaxID=13658 RepID=A0A915HX50_ROMCU